VAVVTVPGINARKIGPWSRECIVSSSGLLSLATRDIDHLTKLEIVRVNNRVESLDSSYGCVELLGDRGESIS
jgi:hypothetical protein